MIKQRKIQEQVEISRGRMIKLLMASYLVLSRSQKIDNLVCECNSEKYQQINDQRKNKFCIVAGRLRCTDPCKNQFTGCGTGVRNQVSSLR